MVHGKERNKTIETLGGNISGGLEKFCVRHGWINVFQIGGKARWEARHAACNQLPGNGADFEQPKVLGKAA